MHTEFCNDNKIKIANKFIQQQQKRERENRVRTLNAKDHESEASIKRWAAWKAYREIAIRCIFIGH